VALSPALTNQYGTAKADSGFNLLGINAFYQLSQPIHALKSLDVQIGPALYKSFAKYSGVETPAINYGGGDTLNYSYNDDTIALLAEAKFIYHIASWQPYFLIGLDTAVTDLSNYSETPSDASGSAVSLPPYQNHSNTNFAYELALGVQKNIDAHFALAADLRDVNFGDGYLTAPSGAYYDQIATLNAKI
jgi:opacity protein-like surface antigen